MEFDIKFRAFKPADAPFINKLRNDEEMESMLGGTKRYVSLERELKWIDQLTLNDDEKNIYFAVTLIGADDIIGYASISEIDYRNGKCFWSGIKIDPQYNGKGYATQVGLKLTKFVFEELRMVKCKGEIQEHHHAALRLLEKIGYVKEGLIRAYSYKNGVHNNTWYMGMIKSEYELVKEKYKL